MENLTSLFSGVRTEDDPTEVLECILGITQLFFDGICGCKLEPDPEKRTVLWESQKNTLNALLDIGRDAAIVARDRDREGLRYIRDSILPMSDCLKKYCYDVTPKTRHLAKMRSYTDAFYSHMDELVRLSGGFDTVVCIASGAFEPTFLISYFAAKETLVLRYSRIVDMDQNVRVPVNAPSDYASSKISGKRVLIIDDIVQTGITMSKVASYVERLKPQALYGVSVRSFMPDLKPSAEVEVIKLHKRPLDLDSTFFFRYILQLNDC